MKKALAFFVAAFFSSAPVFAQIKFSDETKKYIEYNDSTTVWESRF